MRATYNLSLRGNGLGIARVRFDGEADVASELQAVSLDDAQPSVAAPVAAQQVEFLEDAVTYWERGASARRPPTERRQ